MKIVDGSAYLPEVKALIVEYTNALGRDLGFQHLREELEALDEKYTGSQGELLAAVSDDGAVVGCVAYRKLTEQRCEMKRLYVRPAYRTEKLGEQLAKAIIAHARSAGFSEMVLDTLKPMKQAVGLYEKLGFRETNGYYVNPMDDVIYMKLEL